MPAAAKATCPSGRRSIASPSPLPKATPGLAPTLIEAGAPTQTPPSHTEVLTQRQADFSVTTPEKRPSSARPTCRRHRNWPSAASRWRGWRRKCRTATRRAPKRPKKSLFLPLRKNTNMPRHLAAPDLCPSLAWAISTIPTRARRHKLRGNVILTINTEQGRQCAAHGHHRGSGLEVLDDSVRRIAPARRAVSADPAPRKRSANCASRVRVDLPVPATCSTAADRRRRVRRICCSAPFTARRKFFKRNPAQAPAFPVTIAPHATACDSI